MGRAPSIVAAILAALTAPCAAAASEGRYSSIVMTVDEGRVLHSSSADAARRPGGLAQLMTLYLTLEALRAGTIALDEDLLGSPAHNSHSAGSADVTVRDALRAVATTESPSASAMLAERLAGDSAVFAAMATLRARALGLRGSRFRATTPDAPPIRTTTARDLAMIAAALHRDFPEHSNLIVSQPAAAPASAIESAPISMHRLAVTDSALSGHGLVALAARGGHGLIVVVTGAPSARARDRHAANLLDLAFLSLETPAPEQRASVSELILRASFDETETPDRRRLRIVLTEPAEPAPAPSARSVATTSSAPAASAAGGWIVQVGAYASQERARSRLEAVAAVQPGAFAEAERTVVRADGDESLWRARFAGFDREGAEQACDTLRAGGDLCFVAGP